MFDNYYVNINFEFYGFIGVFLVIVFYYIYVIKLVVFLSLYSVNVGMF